MVADYREVRDQGGSAAAITKPIKVQFLILATRREGACPLWVDSVEKVLKCLLAIFLKETKLGYARQLICHPGRCRSLLRDFSLGDEVPHIFIRESHQWARKFLISGGKRLFQQYRSRADHSDSPVSNLSVSCRSRLGLHQRLCHLARAIGEKLHDRREGAVLQCDDPYRYSDIRQIDG
jgi:hypothetical protein